MPITQVSVFLDNHPGSLFETMSHLDKNKIKVFALSIADAGEFGLVRLITEEPEKAQQLLEAAEFNLAKSKKNTEVTATFISEENYSLKDYKNLRRRRYKHRICLFIGYSCRWESCIDFAAQ